MANWANPLITTQYDVFVAEAKERDVDAATMQFTSSTNIPTGTVRFERTGKVFQEWNGTAWVNLIIGVVGGGTGASSGAGAGTALGLGTMAYQNSNAVGISGGTGIFQWLMVLTLMAPPTHLGADLGDAARYFNRAYIGGGLVIPVGVDKYVVG